MDSLNYGQIFSCSVRHSGEQRQVSNHRLCLSTQTRPSRLGQFGGLIWRPDRQHNYHCIYKTNVFYDKVIIKASLRRRTRFGDLRSLTAVSQMPRICTTSATFPEFYFRNRCLGTELINLISFNPSPTFGRPFSSNRLVLQAPECKELFDLQTISLAKHCY